MTLNLPQTLYDLNHHHRLPSSSSARILHPLPRRRFLGLVATCRTYRGILPHLVVLATPPATLAPLLPFSSSQPSLDTLFSHRSTILSRFTAYRRPFLVLLSRIPRESSLPPSRPFHVLPPPLPRTRRNSKPANFDLYPHQRRCTYAGYDLIRRR